jgi:hypothetical protein
MVIEVEKDPDEGEAQRANAESSHKLSGEVAIQRARKGVAEGCEGGEEAEGSQ